MSANPVQLFLDIHELVELLAPGQQPDSIVIHLKGSLPPITMPVPARPIMVSILTTLPPDEPDDVDAAREDTEPFIPTPFQQAILAALDGKALRSDALGDKVGDRSRLWRQSGSLHELRERGLVAHHKRIGFYRPDRPPPALEQATSD